MKKNESGISNWFGEALYFKKAEEACSEALIALAQHLTGDGLQRALGTAWS